MPRMSGMPLRNWSVRSTPMPNPTPGVGGCPAVQAPVTSLNRTAALELAGDGIRVNTIVPFALTPSVAAAFDADPALREAAVADVPMGRIGEPHNDIGRAVTFLCGPDAGYITGTVLSIDGGETQLR